MVCARYGRRGRRQRLEVPLDVHLMVEPVDALAQAFAEAGADLISFHPDASTHVDRTLQLIRAAGCRAGLVFNPAAPIDVLDWVIDKVDLVLVMSVNPGFGGQSFIPSALKKDRAVRDASTRAGATSVSRSTRHQGRQHPGCRRCRLRHVRAGSAIFGAATTAPRSTRARRAAR